ncbi:PREDICTED: F-box/kelch-repeat [Prunus dulcis]|uniref:PREDICTED: F-box/kelch-repeat n=1 Tax=Prunus dulcis TaxID=3755 RepID=A0A5E4G2J6_PRUDU|nr:F-box/kelch-repeat protein At3g06240-like [Prunus dulcis]XP_034211183.1 F-box/kelch-repeat protein At3g06240-like [Prunus dulcis]XP_034211185.1 F-box/kelch-repeat protein At3g06240-like [Prunus dulcis]XP_034211186.1 F-box/kelch-repeat protein At3g06240-like [Prunus dulcis]XP_034211187.1 F-box/kelch-repeat protein At3g06240-like [Prunus dulcis]VVA33924.1 PREDICTED: F-box/kelch-repeat [Prunus dulcis]
MGNAWSAPERTKLRKKMAEQLMDKGNPSLPWELIVEILSWLPVKSLGRFRCVSKPWNALIADPNFIKMHFNKTSENDDVFYQRRRLIFNEPGCCSLYSVNLDQLILNQNNDHGADDLIAPEAHLVCGDLPSYRVVDLFYCDGLLLCKLAEMPMTIYLVNPTTGESEELPEAPDNIQHLGFGFDHSTDDYKVVSAVFYDMLVFCVYSLKTGSWEELECSLPYSGAYTFHAVLLNGTLHWIMETPDQTSMIVAFLLEEEQAGEIPLPVEYSSDAGDCVLGVFRDCLCLTHCSDERTYNEFWVMNEYGEGQSWTKIKISIPYSELSLSGFWKENHDLLVFQKQLVMYNFKEQGFCNLSIPGFPHVDCIGTYLESLVSPNYYGITDREL